MRALILERAGPRVHRRPSAEHGRYRAGGLGAPLAGLPAERPQTPTLSAWYRRIMMRPAAQGVLTLPLE